MVGRREPGIYGEISIETIMKDLTGEAEKLGIRLEVFQSNHEGVLIDRLQEAQGIYDGILLNPGGYSHQSIALRDAVAACGVSVILVHLSNTWARESYRHQDIVGSACHGAVIGLGRVSFSAGLWALYRLSEERPG